MKIDRTKFFDGYKNKFGKINQSQVDALELILKEFENDVRLTNIKWLAYILATAAHETNFTFLPVIEGYYLNNSNRLSILYNYYKKNNRGALKSIFPNGPTNPCYIGRGLVQLTHDFNYRDVGDLLGVDLINNPDRAMEPKIAVEICFTGMLKGLFTKWKLSDFINEKKTDYLKARKIINGMDRAQLIAGYAMNFESFLKPTQEASPEQADSVEGENRSVEPAPDPATPID